MAFIPGERVVERGCDAMGVGTVLEYRHEPEPICIVRWDMRPGQKNRVAAERLVEADCGCGLGDGCQSDDYLR